jgi:hypothetical protein
VESVDAEAAPPSTRNSSASTISTAADVDAPDRVPDHSNDGGDNASES